MFILFIYSFILFIYLNKTFCIYKEKLTLIYIYIYSDANIIRSDLADQTIFTICIQTYMNKRRNWRIHAELLSSPAKVVD